MIASARAKRNGADAAHPFTEPLLPQLAVCVEHDLDRLGICQGVHEERPQVALQLFLRPFLEGGNERFAFCHLSIPVCFARMPKTSSQTNDITNTRLMQADGYSGRAVEFVLTGDPL